MQFFGSAVQLDCKFWDSENSSLCSLYSQFSALNRNSAGRLDCRFRDDKLTRFGELNYMIHSLINFLATTHDSTR